MKRITKLFTLVALVFAAMPSFAQMKIAHVNSDSILVKMPEYQSAMTELEALQAQYQNDIADMRAEIGTLIQTAQANGQSWSTLRLRQAESEVQDKQTKLQEFAMQAQQDLQQQEVALLRPVYEKLYAAIDAVGAAGGYDYVLDASRNQLGQRDIVLFGKKGNDISNLVLTELGLI